MIYTRHEEFVSYSIGLSFSSSGLPLRYNVYDTQWNMLIHNNWDSISWVSNLIYCDILTILCKQISIKIDIRSILMPYQSYNKKKRFIIHRKKIYLESRTKSKFSWTNRISLGQRKFLLYPKKIEAFKKFS